MAGCIREDASYEIACVRCNDVGCEACNQTGRFEVGCPQQYVSDIVPEINLATMCKEGTWPVSGGLLDQSAWFIALHQKLNAEHNRIELEEIEKSRAK